MTDVLKLVICMILTENLKLEIDNEVVYSVAFGEKYRGNSCTSYQLLMFFI